MKNAIAIFKGDLRKLRRNIIAWAIILGLIVVPPLYAWFNISACWDPYGNTRELKIALANNDTGYRGQMLPMNVNLGDNLIAKVRENDKFNWVITDEEEAIEGTKSGEYYAAVVVPESFSSDIMSMFSPNVHPSELVYYVNEKENAIAPKITEKGAQGIKKEVEKNFMAEITAIAVDTAKPLTDNGDMASASQLMGNIAVTVNHVKDIVDAANLSVKSLSSSISSMENLVKSAGSLAASIDQIADTSKGLSSDADKNIKVLINSIDAQVSALDSFLEEIKGTEIPELQQLAAEVKALKSELNQLRSDLKSLKKNSDAAISGTKKISADIDSLSGSTLGSLRKLKKALDSTSPLLDKSSKDLAAMADAIEAGQEAGDTGVLKDVLSQDVEALSTFIAAPVELKRTALYPMDNYGSSMAPFYTSLAIWVGATILVALMSVALEESRRRKLERLKEYQVYLGRYMLFAVIAIAQSGLTCLGDLFFLGI